VQPVSNNPSSAALPTARFAVPIVRTSATALLDKNTQRCAYCLLYAFDLFRADHFHDRAASLFYPAAHANRMTLQLFRIDARGGKLSPSAFGDCNGKIVRPVAPEIQIYRGAAFPHRQDLAFHDCKLTPRSRNPASIVWPQRGKIGVGPKSAA